MPGSFVDSTTWKFHRLGSKRPGGTHMPDTQQLQWRTSHAPLRPLPVRCPCQSLLPPPLLPQETPSCSCCPNILTAKRQSGPLPGTHRRPLVVGGPAHLGPVRQDSLSHACLWGHKATVWQVFTGRCRAQIHFLKPRQITRCEDQVGNIPDALLGPVRSECHAGLPAPEDRGPKDAGVGHRGLCAQLDWDLLAKL